MLYLPGSRLLARGIRVDPVLIHSVIDPGLLADLSSVVFMNYS